MAPRAALHPNLAQIYRSRVANLQKALAGGNAPEALEAARALIDQVIVSPPEFDGDPPGVALVGELVALLRTAGLAPQTESKGAENDHVLGLFAKVVKEGPGASLSPCFLAYSPV